MKNINNHKGLFLCILGLFIAFTANWLGHLSDLSFAIVGIITAYLGGEGVQRSTAFIAASRDPDCNTHEVINSMITGNNNSYSRLQTLKNLASEVEQTFNDVQLYVEGSEKTDEIIIEQDYE